MAQVDSSLNNPNDPTNPNNTPGAVSQPGQQTNQPATTGGGAGPVTATGAGNVTGQVVGTANPSQPFQNIAAYLQANAPQSQALAGQVAGTVSGAINQAQGDIGGAADTFNKSVNTGYAPEHSDVIAGVAKDPTSVVAQGPQSVNDFLSNYNDSYAGPTDFTANPGYANLQSEIAAANTAAANTQTQPGVQTLLQQTEGPTTAGINNLDALLLNLDPKNVGIIQGAAAPAAGLAPSLADAQTSANANVAAAQAAAQTAKTDAQKAFGTASGNLSTGVTSGYDNAVTSAKDFNQNYNDIIARLSGTMPVGTSGGIQQLTPQEQAALNMNQSSLDQYATANNLLQHYATAPDSFLFGEPGLNALPSAGPLPLSSFLTGGNVATLPSDAAAVATPEQYATAKALLALSGGAYKSPLDPANASEAGTYHLNGNPQTFDTSKANGLIDAVTSRDKVVADNLIAQNSGTVNGSFAGVKPGDYAGALAALQKDLASNPGGFNPSLAYEMDALNRLVNGFNAPSGGYTPPTNNPPSLGGGINPNPPPTPPSGGGGIKAR